MIIVFFITITRHFSFIDLFLNLFNLDYKKRYFISNSTIIIDGCIRVIINKLVNLYWQKLNEEELMITVSIGREWTYKKPAQLAGIVEYTSCISVEG